MGSVAVFVYWPIVALWLAVLISVGVLYARNPRTLGTTRLLLAVIALDTLRNCVENVYFGLYFGGQYGVLPQSFASLLGQPAFLILPKLANLAAACLVLGLLLMRWMPAAVRERHLIELNAAHLGKLASTDALTQLFNRRHFLAVAEAEWARAARYRRPLAMLMVDIDHFKAVNDRHGHDAGDAVIAGIAAICRKLSRRSDVVGRLGGEEFAFLLPETTIADAAAFAERLRRAVSLQRLSRPGGDLAVTISIGVSDNSSASSAAELLKHADVALYNAKREGRDCVRRFADVATSGAAD
jgi:diguanylate cyclase (GGDEF)-like protein